jgi:hypothetical protein
MSNDLELKSSTALLPWITEADLASVARAEAAAERGRRLGGYWGSPGKGYTAACQDLTGPNPLRPIKVEWHERRDDAREAARGMRRLHPDTETHRIVCQAARGWSVLAFDPAKPETKPSRRIFYTFHNARVVRDLLRKEHPTFLVEIKPYVTPAQEPWPAPRVALPMPEAAE